MNKPRMRKAGALDLYWVCSVECETCGKISKHQSISAATAYSMARLINKTHACSIFGFPIYMGKFL